MSQDDLHPQTRAERLREASRERRSRKKQEIREAILQASSELFVERGYAEFSLRQVAERIGYSPGTIYLYFRDKDAVLLAVMAEGITHFGEMLSEAAATTHPRERLIRMARAYIAFGIGNPAYYQVMFLQRPDYLTHGSGDQSPAIDGIFALWRAAIEDAIHSGVLRPGDPVGTSDALWALLHGVVALALLMPNFDEARIDSMTETAIKFIARGIHTHKDNP